MSYSARALLVVGVKVVQKEAVVTRTKYNQDTGAPYQVEEKAFRSVVDGTDISADNFPNECDHLHKFHDATYRSDGGDSVWGQALGETSDPDNWPSEKSWIEAIDLDDLQEAKDSVTAELRRYGCNVQPSVYLVLSISY